MSIVQSRGKMRVRLQPNTGSFYDRPVVAVPCALSGDSLDAAPVACRGPGFCLARKFPYLDAVYRHSGQHSGVTIRTPASPKTVASNYCVHGSMFAWLWCDFHRHRKVGTGCHRGWSALSGWRPLLEYTPRSTNVRGLMHVLQCPLLGEPVGA